MRCSWAATAVLLLAAGVQAGRQQETSAQQRALEFLRQDPDSAGMSDLRATDPGAFAIVQALLTKRNLGLLDPRHPSASFATHDDGPTAPHQSFAEAAAAAGLTASSPVHIDEESPVPAVSLSASSPYPEVAGMTHMHHNPWAFHAGGNDDDAMVKNVLGAVAELKSGSSGSLLSSARASSTTDAEESAVVTPPRPRRQSAYSGGMPTLAWGNTFAGTSDATAALAEPRRASPPAPMASMIKMEAPVVQRPVVQAPEPVARRENPYLMGIDLPAVAKPQPHPQEAAVQQNSYLKSSYFSAADMKIAAPLSEVQPAPVAVKPAPKLSAAAVASNSYLKGIDFGSDVDDSLSYQEKAKERLSKSSFHEQMMKYRAEKSETAATAPAPQASLVASASTLGESFTNDLKAAREKRWQTALETSGLNGDSPITGMLQQSITADNEDSVQGAETKVKSWLNGGAAVHVAPAASSVEKMAAAKASDSYNIYMSDLKN